GCPSLDDLIRPHQERRWDRKTESLGGLQVDDELEQDRLLNCEIGMLGPLQDLVDVGGGASLEIGLDDNVGHQAATLIGHIVRVALFAACAAGVVVTAMMSALRRRHSAASAGNSSPRPSAVR